MQDCQKYQELILKFRRKRRVTLTKNDFEFVLGMSVRGGESFENDGIRNPMLFKKFKALEK